MDIAILHICCTVRIYLHPGCPRYECSYIVKKLEFLLNNNNNNFLYYFTKQ